jgi:flagellar hook-associated protein 2
MQVADQPLTTLNNNITAAQTLISDLGTMTSKVDALQQAVNAFESASTYTNPTASSSDSSIATASATSNNLIGTTTQVSVSQLAQASSLILHASSSGSGSGTTYTDFGSSTDNTAITSANPFTITIGTGSSAVTYSTANSNTPITATGTASGGSAGSAVTIADLATWVNSLGANVQANVVQTTGASDYVLQIVGTQTGQANAVTVGGSGISSNAVQTVESAQDAQATINGLSIDRATNSIDDVVNGLTINLTGVSSTGSGGTTSSANITVAQGADTTDASINALITAYNGVISTYNTLTANSNSGSTTATNGDLANNPVMLSFVNDMKEMFAQGATDPSTASITGLSSTSSTLSLNSSGYLEVGTTQYPFSQLFTQAGTTSPTASQFITWVNSLGAGVTASPVSSTDDSGNTTTSIAISNSSSNSSLSTVDLSGVNNTVQRNTLSLASMGMDLQLDGTMQFDTTEYQTAVSNGLASQLAKGLQLGFTDSSSNLDNFLTGVLDPSNGILANDVATENTSVTEMQSQASALQERLTQLQESYVTQYSALNTLLYQLNSTSTALSNGLLAVTNINAGNK